MEVGVSSGGRQNADPAAGKTLSEVIVGFALQTQVQAANGKGPERLTGGTFELDVDGIVGQTCFAVFAGNSA